MLISQKLTWQQRRKLQKAVKEETRTCTLCKQHNPNLIIQHPYQVLLAYNPSLTKRLQKKVKTIKKRFKKGPRFWFKKPQKTNGYILDEFANLQSPPHPTLSINVKGNRNDNQKPNY